MNAFRIPLNTNSADQSEALCRIVTWVYRYVQTTSSLVRQRYAMWKASKLSTCVYLTLVASVSIYDIILTILYAPCLKYVEENPIARWILELDTLKGEMVPDLTLFLTMKSIGTIFVLGTMFSLLNWRSKVAHPVAIGVTSFQVLLAGYLTFATV